MAERVGYYDLTFSRATTADQQRRKHRGRAGEQRRAGWRRGEAGTKTTPSTSSGRRTDGGGVRRLGGSTLHRL